MNFSFHMIDASVPESYSRMLDERVSRQEMPYGYTNEPPPADTGDYDQRKLNEKRGYSE